MRYQVTLEGLALPRPAEAQPHDADRLEAHLERVMDELVRLRAQDATVGGSLARGEVEISVVVEAKDLESAPERAQAVVRMALEAAGGSLSEWAFDWISIKAARIESLARATG